MKDIKLHKINLPSEIIKKCWGIYSQKYKEIEDGLINTSDTTSNLKEYVHTTGAFQLTIASLQNLKSDDLTNYFVSEKTSKLAIRMKTKIVFRGLDYFVGLYKVSNQEKLQTIFQRLEEMLKILADVKPDSNKILYLALTDYIRNYLMILLYVIHQTVREIGNVNIIEKDYVHLTHLIKEIEEKFTLALLASKNEPLEDIGQFTPSLHAIEAFLIESLPFVEKNKKLSVDLVRRIRECNHPIKILNFAKAIAESLLPRGTVLIGLEYGGIELPFVINAYRKILGKSEFEVQIANLSSYSTGSKRYVDYIEDALSPFSGSKELSFYKVALILDDSITTGRTVEYLVKLLPKNIEEVYLSVVSFTNTNRYHHLTRYGHGGINPFVLRSGRILYKSNYTQTYTRESYTNRRGVFDKEKNKIMLMLKENYLGVII